MRLVLPAPRKPVITVAGIRVVMGNRPLFGMLVRFPFAPPARAWSGRLEEEGDPRGDEHHPVRPRRERLVEAPRMVAEGAGHRVVRDHPEPDLVRDEDDRHGQRGERF